MAIAVETPGTINPKINNNNDTIKNVSRVINKANAGKYWLNTHPENSKSDRLSTVLKIPSIRELIK
tara:strand:+ start:2623 stop:2820 length:198 start_codon:yes stop_codon:yes gene_type:complete